MDKISTFSFIPFVMQFLQGSSLSSFSWITIFFSETVFINFIILKYFSEKMSDLDLLFLNSEGGIYVAKYGNPISLGFYFFCWPFCFSNYLILPIVRFQTLLAQNNERGCINSSGVESQAAKRQKLEGGHLFKVLNLLFPVLVPLICLYFGELVQKFYILNMLNSLMSFS